MLVANFGHWSWSQTTHDDFEGVFGESMDRFLTGHDISAKLIWDRYGPSLVFRTQIDHDRFFHEIKSIEDLQSYFGSAHR